MFSNNSWSYPSLPNGYIMMASLVEYRRKANINSSEWYSQTPWRRPGACCLWCFFCCLLRVASFFGCFAFFPLLHLHLPSGERRRKRGSLSFYFYSSARGFKKKYSGVKKPAILPPLDVDEVWWRLFCPRLVSLDVCITYPGQQCDIFIPGIYDTMIGGAMAIGCIAIGYWRCCYSQFAKLSLYLGNSIIVCPHTLSFGTYISTFQWSIHKVVTDHIHTTQQTLYTKT